MKYDMMENGMNLENTARPVWGAWIEIETPSAETTAYASRPVWGAWIEIKIALGLSILRVPSRPVWGAWIEIHA